MSSCFFFVHMWYLIFSRISSNLFMIQTRERAVQKNAMKHCFLKAEKKTSQRHTIWIESPCSQWDKAIMTLRNISRFNLIRWYQFWYYRNPFNSFSMSWKASTPNKNRTYQKRNFMKSDRFIDWHWCETDRQTNGMITSQSHRIKLNWMLIAHHQIQALNDCTHNS